MSGDFKVRCLGMKIVVLDGYVLNPGDLSWKGIEALGELTVYDRTTPEETLMRIGDAEAIFTNKTILTNEILEKCPKLKFVGVLATGYNVLDVVYARELGITVCNVPAYSTMSVAQFTLGLLLEICHNIGSHSIGVMSGDWTKSKDFSYWNTPLIELDGKTFGIIGFGKIGKAVANIVQTLGMKVAVYSHYPDKSLESESFKFVTLDELFASSNVISLHCPLSERTQGIINKENIAKMKNNVIIINTGRGPLVVEQDLADALNAGKVYGAAVDVISVEPMQKDNPLLKAKNCIITPHIAWAPLEARKRLMKITTENLAGFIANKPINVVN